MLIEKDSILVLFITVLDRYKGFFRCLYYISEEHKPQNILPGRILEAVDI